MLDFFRRLQEDTESHRKRTAFIVALSFTGIIGVAYLMFVTAGSSVSYDAKATSATSSSPVAAIGEVFKASTDAFDALVNLFKDSKEIIFEAASSTAVSTTTIATSTPN